MCACSQISCQSAITFNSEQVDVVTLGNWLAIMLLALKAFPERQVGDDKPSKPKKPRP